MLGEVGLLCDRCDEKPEWKAALGCGVAPVDEDEWGDMEPCWSLAEFYLYAEGLNRKPDAEWASREIYSYANIGHTASITGSCWEWCPAWYARHSPKSLQFHAERAIRAAYWADRGLLDAVEPLPLANDMVGLVEIVLRAIKRDEAERAAQVTKTFGGA